MQYAIACDVQPSCIIRWGPLESDAVTGSVDKCEILRWTRSCGNMRVGQCECHGSAGSATLNICTCYGLSITGISMIAGCLIYVHWLKMAVWLSRAQLALYDLTYLNCYLLFRSKLCVEENKQLHVKLCTMSQTSPYL